MSTAAPGAAAATAASLNLNNRGRGATSRGKEANKKREKLAGVAGAPVVLRQYVLGSSRYLSQFKSSFCAPSLCTTRKEPR